MSGAVLVKDPADTPRAVEELKERLDVLDHGGVPHGGHHGRQRLPHSGNHPVAARPELGMKAHYRLQERQRRHQFLAAHVLRPRDPLVQHERFIAAELVKAAEGGALRGPIAQQDVRGEPRPAHVQDGEALPFPFLRGAEVKHCADQRRAAVIHELPGGADPLESVDNVHVTGDRVGSIGVGASVTVAADRKFHVGHAPGAVAERLHQPLNRGFPERFALIFRL